MKYIAIMLLAAVTLPTMAEKPRDSTPEISITTSAANKWRLDYRLRNPTRELVFVRSPDDSRTKLWQAPPEFEIVATASGELLRRKDGGPFKEVRVEVPPVYSPLPKDYAPFSPFGDGGMLFHTGRFFACAKSCDDSTQWSMQLRVSAGNHILLNGVQKQRRADWRDGGDGQNVYVGKAIPVTTQDVITVIDATLPATIRDQLIEQLPRFMRHFSAQFGELPTKPMLFASYDANYATGSGRQGGTLTGQVFAHFYGPTWPEEMAKPNFANDLAWFFAHEAAHLSHRQTYSHDSSDAWIHEGAAEAFAALALRDSDASSVAYVNSRIQAAEEQCAQRTKDQTIREAIKTGGYDVAYTCGLVINLNIHAALLRSAPDSDGLHALWREYIVRAESQQAGDPLYAAVLAKLGGQRLANAVQEAVRTTTPNLHVGD